MFFRHGEKEPRRSGNGATCGSEPWEDRRKDSERMTLLPVQSTDRFVSQDMQPVLLNDENSDDQHALRKNSSVQTACREEKLITLKYLSTPCSSFSPLTGPRTSTQTDRHREQKNFFLLKALHPTDRPIQMPSSLSASLPICLALCS